MIDGSAGDVLRVAAAQLPNVVGDLEGNAGRILDAMRWAEAEGADVVVFGELALTGYPLGDLAGREDFVSRAIELLEELAARSGSTAAVVSSLARVTPKRSWDTRARSVAIGAAVLCDGELRGTYHKVLLPNYGVFDEARTFAPGGEPAAVWRIGEAVAGIAICEDLWSGDGPPELQAAAGARILLVPNASPFRQGKAAGRYELAAQVARRNATPVVYVNCVGGQDDLVFDGGSIVVDAGGRLLYRARQFTTERFVLDVALGPRRSVNGPVCTVHARPARQRRPVAIAAPAAPASDDEQVWEALVLGTRDFVAASGAKGVALGLSGGIDAAVTASVAADAIAPRRVLGIAMPEPGSPEEELEDARALADALGIHFTQITLDASTYALAKGLQSVLASPLGDQGQRALEARTRAALLWTVCDGLSYLPLATGNKSELSMGTAFLNGDMAGAFAPLRDCRKTLVHALARLRNERAAVIPERTLRRAPSQWPVSDAGGPPSDEVDVIVERYIDRGESAEDLIADGFEAAVVRRVLQRVDDAELQRRQTPPGVRITQRAFGQDLHMPISNAWRPFGSEIADVR